MTVRDLQNIPIVGADYSQIELRVRAHLSKDPVLVDVCRSNQDVHVRTAMEIFGVDAAGVTAEMRRRSKTINFTRAEAASKL